MVKTRFGDTLAGEAGCSRVESRGGINREHGSTRRHGR
jgi:hypothetical protein